MPPVPDEPGTGYGTPSTTVNAQVNGHGTGGTGTTPFKAQHSAGTGSSAAYLNGLCRDGCGNPHSPGRIRCDECYRIWQTTIAGHER